MYKRKSIIVEHVLDPNTKTNRRELAGPTLTIGPLISRYPQKWHFHRPLKSDQSGLEHITIRTMEIEFKMIKWLKFIVIAKNLIFIEDYALL